LHINQDKKSLQVYEIELGQTKGQAELVQVKGQVGLVKVKGRTVWLCGLNQRSNQTRLDRRSN